MVFQRCEFFASGIPDVGTLSEEEIRAGFTLFFINEPLKAEEFFDEFQNIGLFVMGKAAIRFLWAMLSLEDEDLDIAVQQLKYGEEFSSAALKAINPHRFWTKPELTLENVHYRIMGIECTLLLAIIQLLAPSLIDKMKGALSIRNAWQRLTKLTKDIESTQKTDPSFTIDKECQAALDFETGTFNVICSILPPKIMKLVSMLGFPIDRALGLKLLSKSFMLNGVRSPLAGLVLLCHHVILQTHLEGDNARYAREAVEVLDVASQRYPNSGLFAIMHGRLMKLRRQLMTSIQFFEQARTALSQWRPMVDLCHYEAGFSAMIQFDFQTSITHWQHLYETNDWSKVFYCYCIATCHFAAGQETLALDYFDKIKDLERKRIGGKQLPVDKFAKRKFEQYYEQRLNLDICIPHIELIYIWGGFYQADESLLKRMLEQIESAEDKAQRIGQWELYAVSALLSGAIYLQLGSLEISKSKLEAVIANSGRISNETWVVPYARFELAMVLKQTSPRGWEDDIVKSTLKQVFQTKSHNFDMRLHVRTHLALYNVKHNQALELGHEDAVELNKNEVPKPQNNKKIFSSDIVELALKAEAIDPVVSAV